MTPDPYVGAVAGFAVRSEVPLAYLRSGPAETPLDVRVGSGGSGTEPPDPPLREWTPLPENPFRAKLWRADGVDRLWIDGVGWYSIDPRTGGIEIPAGADPVAREERLWGIPTSLCIVARGDQTLHAGSVDVGGAAILIGAPGRHGKTTLVAALHAAGYRLLSEDTTRCRPAAEALAFPGPAMFRVRRDSFEHLGLDGTRVVGEDPDRVHLAVDPARRGSADPVPIAGILLLRTADEIRLERLAPELAIPELWALAFKLPTDEDRARCFAAIGGLVASVPVWNLHRPMTYGALDEVVERIASLAG